MRYSNQATRPQKVQIDSDSPLMGRAKECSSTLKPDTKKKSQAKHKKANSSVQQAPPPLIINTYNTCYDVLSIVAQDLGFRERKVDPGLCPNPYLFLEGNNQGGATFNFQ